MDRNKASYFLFIGGLLILTFSLPLSKAGMSISQMFMGAGWLLSGDYSGKFRKFLKNKTALLITSVYMIHVLGLLWSEDMSYAMKDLRIKLPLLILPFMMSTFSPVLKDHFLLILLTGVTGVFLSTLISFGVFLGFGNVLITDIRDISVFVSHIRLSLMICMAIGVLFYLIQNYSKRFGKPVKVIFIAVTAWFVFFLFLLESLTGILILLSGTLVILTYYVIQRRLWKLMAVSLIAVLVLVISFGSYISGIISEITAKPEVDFSALERYTPSGNEYSHEKDAGLYENGNYIWMYVSDVELESEWSKRSDIGLYETDARDQVLKMTLVRYLASRGLRKDSAGVASLTDDDVEKIEMGLANYKYKVAGSFETRLRQVIWELDSYYSGRNPDGHSVAQRFEYWKASAVIITSSPVFGVGTGDVPRAFDQYYTATDSWLEEKWRLRSHNQYLSITVAFGLAGLTVFLIALIYPLGRMIRSGDLLYLIFILIASLSMITEDTLETQAGVTFFTFFNCLFLFSNPSSR